jgi:hypothetical protein
MLFADETEQRRLLLDTAKKYQGVRYLYNGTTPNGFDCSGFVKFVYKTALNIDIPRSSAAIWGAAALSIPVTDAKQGDVLVFANRGKIDHVSIKWDNEQMIHAVSDGNPTGILIGKIMSSYFGPRIYGAKRFIPGSTAAIVPAAETTPAGPAAAAPAAPPAAAPQPAAPAATTPVNSPIQPPLWIQGEWSYVTQKGIEVRVQFTANDILVAGSSYAAMLAGGEIKDFTQLNSNSYVVKITYSDDARSDEEFSNPRGEVRMRSYYKDTRNTIAELCNYQKVVNTKREPANMANIAIKPPDWIQGNWKITDGLSSYRFTANDIYIDGYSVTEALKIGEIADIELQEAGSTYFIKLLYPNGDWTTERFAREVNRNRLSSLYSDMRSFRRSEVMFQYNRDE